MEHHRNPSFSQEFFRRAETDTDARSSSNAFGGGESPGPDLSDGARLDYSRSLSRTVFGRSLSNERSIFGIPLPSPRRSPSNRSITGKGLSPSAIFVRESTDVMFVLSPSTGDILHASEAACFALGFSCQELLERRILDLADGLKPADWTKAVSGMASTKGAWAIMRFKLMKSDRRGALVGQRVDLELQLPQQQQQQSSRSKFADSSSPASVSDHKEVVATMMPASDMASPCSPSPASSGGRGTRPVEIFLLTPGMAQGPGSVTSPRAGSSSSHYYPRQGSTPGGSQQSSDTESEGERGVPSHSRSPSFATVALPSRSPPNSVHLPPPFPKSGSTTSTNGIGSPEHVSGYGSFSFPDLGASTGSLKGRRLEAQRSSPEPPGNAHASQRAWSVPSPDEFSSTGRDQERREGVEGDGRSRFGDEAQAGGAAAGLLMGRAAPAGGDDAGAQASDPSSPHPFLTRRESFSRSKQLKLEVPTREELSGRGGGGAAASVTAAAASPVPEQVLTPGRKLLSVFSRSKKGMRAGGLSPVEAPAPVASVSPVASRFADLSVSSGDGDHQQWRHSRDWEASEDGDIEEDLSQDPPEWDEGSHRLDSDDEQQHRHATRGSLTLSRSGRSSVSSPLRIFSPRRKPEERVRTSSGSKSGLRSTFSASDTQDERADDRPVEKLKHRSHDRAGGKSSSGAGAARRGAADVGSALAPRGGGWGDTWAEDEKESGMDWFN